MNREYTADLISISFLNCGKIHITQNAPFEPFLKAQFDGTKYIHIVLQL